MTIDITPLAESDYPRNGRSGVLITDSIEAVRFPLFTPTPTPISVQGEVDQFDVPLDTTIEIETRRLSIPKRSRLFVRPADSRTPHTQFDPMDGSASLSDRPHVVEVNTAPVKLYLAVESAIDITTTAVDDRDEVWLEFPDQASVVLGVRSFHDHPANTITTPPDPESVMAAVSQFGSALKTTSPERSFPTLRGHPPLVEVGSEFHVPDGIETPETEVRLELPVEYEYIYPAVPLAFYLGADVVPGDQHEPRLVTDDGFAYDLARTPGYEETVSRVLRQVFLLDCVTRTEGLYPDRVHERNVLDDRINLDYQELYELSLAERTRRYLDVSWETVADVVPEWPRTIDIVPEPDTISACSFAAADLAAVRAPSGRETEPSPPPDSVRDFYRTPDPGIEVEETTGDGDSGGDGGGDGDGSEEVPEIESKLVTPDRVPWETLDHVRAGSGVPVGGHKLRVDARERSLDASPADHPISIHVVCNDDRMAAEGGVADVYGVRDLVEFNVVLHENVSTSELEALLRQDADFLHYIGHVDDRGIECRDGFFDARELSTTGVTAFLLNACQSFEQGVALVDAGSLGGAVTMEDVPNQKAMQIGRAVAHLLNAGFSLQAAMRIARRETMSGFRWLSLGDGTVSLCEPASGCPLHVSVEPTGDVFETTVRALPGPAHQLGSIFNVHTGRSDASSLVPMQKSFSLSGEELDLLLNRERRLPVEVENELLWSCDVSSDVLG